MVARVVMTALVLQDARRSYTQEKLLNRQVEAGISKYGQPAVYDPCRMDQAPKAHP